MDSTGSEDSTRKMLRKHKRSQSLPAFDLIQSGDAVYRCLWCLQEWKFANLGTKVVVRAPNNAEICSDPSVVGSHNVCGHKVLIEVGFDMNTAISVAAGPELNYEKGINDSQHQGRGRVPTEGNSKRSEFQGSLASSFGPLADPRSTTDKTTLQASCPDFRHGNTSCHLTDQIGAVQFQAYATEHKQNILEDFSAQDKDRASWRDPCNQYFDGSMPCIDNEEMSAHYEYSAVGLNIVAPNFNSRILTCGMKDSGSWVTCIAESLARQFPKYMRISKNIKALNTGKGSLVPLYRLRLPTQIALGDGNLWRELEFDVLDDVCMPRDLNGQRFMVVLSKKVCKEANLFRQESGSIGDIASEQSCRLHVNGCIQPPHDEVASSL